MHAGAAGPAGAADAVHVRLGVVRDVVVDDMRDAFDVQTARGDVGGDQDVDRAVLERGDRALTLGLVDVTVDGRSRETAGREPLGDLLGGLLGADEHDHRVALFDLEHPRQRVQLARTGHLDEPLRDVLGGGGLGLDRDLDRIVQVLGGDLADGRRHGGREQRHLLVLRGVGEDPLDLFGEAHGEHFVGLVEHQVVQVRQIQRAALEVIDHPARGTHHHLRPAPQARQLNGVGRPAVDGQHVDRGQMRAVPAECLGDLQCQLTSRCQHQRLGGAAGGVDLGQDRDGEGRGLAGTGLGQPDHIGAREHGRNGRGLNRRRRLVADISHCLQHRRVNLQVGKRWGGIPRIRVWRGHRFRSLVPIEGNPGRAPAQTRHGGAVRLPNCESGRSVRHGPRGRCDGRAHALGVRIGRFHRLQTPDAGPGPAPTSVSAPAAQAAPTPAPPQADPLRGEPGRPRDRQGRLGAARDPRSNQSWSPEPLAGNYNECAQLSAVIVRANTNSEHPNTRAVLFHLGKFIPTGVPDTYGFNGIDKAASTGDTVALEYSGGFHGLASTVKFRWNGGGVELMGNI